MRIAYLINRYPAASHSFIRREIRAPEANGIQVTRFSIRQGKEELGDGQDLTEQL